MFEILLYNYLGRFITIITIFIELGIPCLINNDFKPIILNRKRTFKFSNIHAALWFYYFCMGCVITNTVLKGNCTLNMIKS